MLIRKTVAKGIRIGMDLMLYDYRHWLEYEILPAGATTTRLVSSFTSLKQRTSSSRLNLGTDPAVSRSTLHIDDTVPAHPPGGAIARQRPGCASNASVQPPTQTTRWMPMLQRAANTEPMPSSALSSCCGPLASTDGRSVGFSTRRDDPSNREFSSIDNISSAPRPSIATEIGILFT